MAYGTETVRYIIDSLWILLFGYWILKSFGNKKDARKFSFWLHGTWPLSITAIILWTFLSPSGMNRALISQTKFSQILGILLCAAGVTFAIWARKTLSTNWSAQVVIKENYELITTGPYAIVRHPIYTGFITTLLGTIIAINISILSIVAEVLVVLYLWWKLRREENIITAQFPGEYSEYKKSVRSAIIPFLL